MKHLPNLICIAFFLLSPSLYAQYTEVINSNRPGVSTGAYAVGKNVLQGEFGLVYEKREHDGLRTESRDFAVDFAIRYGLLLEELEVIWEGTYTFQELTLNGVNPPVVLNNSNFLRHTLGVKYLIFDPYKNPENTKPNLYSWKANNSFKWKDLIPAISLYAGANIIFSGNPFLPEDPSISPRVAIATQSHIAGRWVVIGNIIYDKFTTDDPILSYVLSVTHNLRNPKWSVFLENQGINSDAFADISLRGGAARLINENFQVDASIGTSFKDTPSRLFGTIGVSYRLDNHTDEPKTFDSRPPKRRKKNKRSRKKDNEKNNSDNNPFQQR
ncbi:transporter [Leptobacterium flavescens]|uniref:Transporter n=1 Tax=Leptobacterium flavescens TaxID=472055 RepID=A0A6P0USJ0_9FLAO|nr:transporter [Leptobacterium flavescens]NER13833.1 transporter [Leptobacterium flavescens]